MTDFVMTIQEEEEGSEEDEEKGVKEIEVDFKFDIDEVRQKPWNFDEARKKILPRDDSKRTTIDQKIQRVITKTTKELQDVSDSEEKSGDENDDGQDEGTDVSELNLDANTRNIREYMPKRQKKEKFFSKPPTIIEATDTFESLHISRPLVKAVSEMGWKTPTPIQQQVVPIALLGRDIAASAVTGSGKTAAFVLPILERLLFRDSRSATVRVLILTPTRELAAQCQSVIVNLAKYTDIRCALVLGGLSLSQQTVELHSRPDIIVATPGRIIDHLLNTLSFGLEELEILVLDEADRLLELGFKDEIEQIVNLCPKSRQSMLFSATMTEKVSQLATLSLHRPVRVSADPLMHTSKKLTQEFVRIRKTDGDREAVLLALCTRTFKSAVLIFFQEKKAAHRMKIIFGLAGLSAAELHGNLTQLQRLDALEQFRDGVVNYLLATDLASRGLDILGMQTVINFTMPVSEALYVHRVGRTARAGKKGRSVSLVGDTGHERNMLKLIVKHSSQNSCKHRVVPADIIKSYRVKIENMSQAIAEVLLLEQEEKAVRVAEMEAEKALNIIKYKDEIESRPARTWFMTESDKKRLKVESKQSLQTEIEPTPVPDDHENTGKIVGESKPAYVPSRIPSIKTPLTRKQKKKKEAKETMLTPSQLQLAKKRNKVKAQLKRQRSHDKVSNQPPAKKQKNLPSSKKEKRNSIKDTAGTPFHFSKSKGKFKSKKRHKRR